MDNSLEYLLSPGHLQLRMTLNSDLLISISSNTKCLCFIKANQWQSVSGKPGIESCTHLNIKADESSSMFKTPGSLSCPRFWQSVVSGDEKAWEVLWVEPKRGTHDFVHTSSPEFSHIPSPDPRTSEKSSSTLGIYVQQKHFIWWKRRYGFLIDW